MSWVVPNRLGCSFALDVSICVGALPGGGGRLVTGRSEERLLVGVSFDGGRVKLMVCGRKLKGKRQYVPRSQASQERPCASLLAAPR